MNKERTTLVAEYIINKGDASVKELANKFNVSTVTIRRDLNKLENTGVITKYYGGVKPALENMSDFNLRLGENLGEKDSIAKNAAKLIKENDIIFIDSGTTTSKILDKVDQFITLTIFTNNLNIVNKAVSMPNTDIVLVGDFYSRISNSFIYRANFSELNYEILNIDKAFVSASGITLEKGLTNRNPLEQEIKVNTCRISDKIYCLMDHTKFDNSYMLKVLDLKDIEALITDKKPTEEYLHYFKQNNIKLIY